MILSIMAGSAASSAERYSGPNTFHIHVEKAQSAAASSLGSVTTLTGTTPE